MEDFDEYDARRTRQQIANEVQSGLTHKDLTEAVLKRASAAFDPRTLASKPIPASVASKTIKLNQQLNTALNGDAERHERAKNAAILNSYKKTYNGKIDFTFKASYSSDLDPALLESHLKQVRTLVNSTDAPYYIEKVIKKAAWGIGLLGKIAFIDTPGINFDDLEDSVSKAIDRGEFAEEVTQLAIEYQHWLAIGPIPRAFNKIMTIASEEASLAAVQTTPAAKTTLKDDDL